MPYLLSNLIKASGYAGTPGQSFDNHVAGSAGGVGCSMEDYKVYGIAALSGDVPNDGIQTDDNYLWNFQITWNRGSHAQHIQALRDHSALPYTQVTSSEAGHQANIESRSWDSTRGIVTLGIRTRGKLVDTLRYPLAEWDYPYGPPDDGPPDDATSHYVRFYPATHPIGSLSYSTLTFNVRYQPDNGPYNPEIVYGFSVAVDDRYEQPTDWYAYQWSDDGVGFDTTNGFDNVVSTAYSHSALCPYGGSVTRWLAIKRTSSEGWMNLGSVTFEDPRGGL